MGRGQLTAPSAPYLSVMDQYGYQLGKVIGHGSYGTVYEAYFTKQKAKVAIKIISKKKASEDYLNKFLPREIQVARERRGMPWSLRFRRRAGPQTELRAVERPGCAWRGGGVLPRTPPATPRVRRSEGGQLDPPTLVKLAEERGLNPK
uniref:Protein kinase domain-containing protein n=1 Tax=Chelonoidis abingdonii TaxID=106734 RepID=A0A8C0GG84_CHEAB